MADTITTFAENKSKNDSLVLGTLDCYVLAKPYDATIPERITDADGKLLSLPGFVSVGEFQKDAGVGLAFSRDVEGPEGFGSKGRRRNFVTNEGLTVSLTAQESSLNTMGLAYDLDTKSLVGGNQADGGFLGWKQHAVRLPEYTLVIVGMDGSPNQELYPFWIVPKVTMTSTGDINLTDSGALEYGLEFEATEDPKYGLYGVGIVGPGMKNAKFAELFYGTEADPVIPGGGTGE